jgi:transmembrane sensor
LTRVREDAARWFARMRNAEVDDPRRSLFESWLTSDPAHAREYAAFEAMWRRLDDLQGWETIDRGMTQRGKRRRLLKGGLGAAVLALVGGLGRWWWLDAPVWEMAWQTGKGEIMHEILNDGSRLALAAGSEASGVYTRRERRVSLKRGEAAFEVRHDPAWPFVVDAGELRVTVLGTRFAVSRLAGRTRVSVERGQVRVVLANRAGVDREEREIEQFEK